ncbi:hypothetical protein [Phenylobacterium sp.]|uniref:hypothetical protein n=1 Tax=Phenylobacterium sp. TaxID=1871053 RepID=UPI0011FA3361|nr:hypothetical protein [Phenylobacterium sp.]THD63901.1 MAG: hypothetical protein E8A49_04295 [Phenylobacterium sp.]
MPPALLAASLGFALAFVPKKAVAPSIVVFAGIAAAVSLVRTDPGWTDAIFYACWASVIVTALAVHLPKEPPPPAVLVLAANAGLWSGAVIAAAGAPFDLVKSLPFVLICLPASWLIARRLGIAVKVVASWLIAVSVLAAALPTLTPTPGYVGDHME